jgi:hypothetical protein
LRQTESADGTQLNRFGPLGTAFRQRGISIPPSVPT